VVAVVAGRWQPPSNVAAPNRAAMVRRLKRARDRGSWVAGWVVGSKGGSVCKKLSGGRAPQAASYRLKRVHQGAHDQPLAQLGQRSGSFALESQRLGLAGQQVEKVVLEKAIALAQRQVHLAG